MAKVMKTVAEALASSPAAVGDVRSPTQPMSGRKAGNPQGPQPSRFARQTSMDAFLTGRSGGAPVRSAVQDQERQPEENEAESGAAAVADGNIVAESTASMAFDTAAAGDAIDKLDVKQWVLQGRHRRHQKRSDRGTDSSSNDSSGQSDLSGGHTRDRGRDSALKGGTSSDSSGLVRRACVGRARGELCHQPPLRNPESRPKTAVMREKWRARTADRQGAGRQAVKKASGREDGPRESKSGCKECAQRCSSSSDTSQVAEMGRKPAQCSHPPSGQLT